MTDNITQDADSAAFTITRKENIVERLALMQTQSVFLNVKPVSAADNCVITTIITKILPDKNLFAIDVSADAALNEAIKTGGQLQFSATVNGVAVRFNTSSVTPATLAGHPVFAAPIPTSLYWRERRRSYRMPIPLVKPITCTMLLPGLNLDKFPVLDISQTGFALLDENQLVMSAVQVGHVFQGCQFSKPLVSKEPFVAKLCRTEEVGRNGKLRSFKLGLRFEKMSSALENDIKKLLQELTQKRRR
ncbi:flagellar brake protein [Candidatus Methylospira mobilis]|nr:flagellar brake protein [Candidatus Methylospira mobilis]WNV05734.1 flagellar brake protein [Candidatus Methylospira mobilis]